MRQSVYITGSRHLSGTTLEMLPVKLLKPPHGMWLHACRRIIKSMKRHGWYARPLLAFRCGRKYQLITGSHRLVAARHVKMDKVPVFVITDDTLSFLRTEYGFVKCRWGSFFYRGWDSLSIAWTALADDSRRSIGRKLFDYVHLDKPPRLRRRNASKRSVDSSA